MLSQKVSYNENIQEITDFEKLITNTENAAKHNKNIFFKDKSLLLEQTRNLKLKCKYLKNDESQKILTPIENPSSSKKFRSKSMISHNKLESYDENLSFCQKSNRTTVNLEDESKISDPSNPPLMKNLLKFSNASSILNNNDNDLSTTIPHSFYDKTSEISKTFKVKNNEKNEHYENRIKLLEDKVKELRLELGSKEIEIKTLKQKGLFHENIDFNEIFDTNKLKKLGFKKICNDHKAFKRTYEVKLQNQEKKNKKMEEIYKKQQDEMCKMSIFIEDIMNNLKKNESEFEIIQKNNQILIEKLKEAENFKHVIGKQFEKFRGNMEEKLKYYAGKLQKLNENEKLYERISAENQELKVQKNFLMQKIQEI